MSPGRPDIAIVPAPDQSETAFLRLSDDGRVSVIEKSVSVYPEYSKRLTVNIGDVPAYRQDAKGLTHCPLSSLGDQPPVKSNHWGPR
jgi:hypothetical protein